RVMNLCELRPSRVLDLGAGPGPMAAAAFDRGARHLCLVDHSDTALSLAGRLLVDPERYHGADSKPGAGEGASSVPKASHPAKTTKPPTIQCIQADLESPQAIPEGPFDLIILGHCLNELGAGEPDQVVRVERRVALVQRAASVLTPGGSVMIVDPATLASARDGMALRNHLASLGWRVAGPCTRQGPCPALAAGENQSCHDEAAWAMPESVRRLAEGAGLDREKIKMFWLVVQPPVQGRGGDRADEDGDRAGAGAVSGTQLYRVVSEPMLNKAGRVRYLLCGPRGRFPFSAKRDDPAAVAGGFFRLGRYDLIQVEEPESREGGGWGFGPETRIRLVLPSGAGAGRIDP
ncbi:MAG: small ribosomal subunit Rsm22 family protein, partial [Spirochaetia bacterium]|nr:small ribosomal subunit Rsm22 family protein [Spirochaetia bacterium]